MRSPVATLLLAALLLDGAGCGPAQAEAPLTSTPRGAETSAPPATPPPAAPPPADSATASAVPPAPPAPPGQASASPPAPPSPACSGASLDLDKVQLYQCPGPPDKPTPVAASSLSVSVATKQLRVKRDQEATFEVVLTNTTDAPLAIELDASCGMPAFRAGVEGKREAPGATGGPVAHGPCRAVLCMPRTIHLTLAPHGTVRHTARVYPGEKPPYYCEGKPNPYPPGAHYTVSYVVPVAVQGGELKVSIPLTITP